LYERSHCIGARELSRAFFVRSFDHRNNKVAQNKVEWSNGQRAHFDEAVLALNYSWISTIALSRGGEITV